MTEARDLRAEFAERLAALPPDRLEALARRLAAASPPGRASSARPTETGPTETGAMTLVAYVASRGPSAPTAEDLRSHLAETLPEYMVPPTVVVLDELPLTSTGKVDRKALPDPTRAVERAGPEGDPATASSGSAPPAAPRNAAEALLTKIWAEVLGFDEVGIDDNFFEMGGDSLLSIRIIARAAQAGLRITPREFFDRPTVAGMAAQAAQAAANEASVARLVESGDPAEPVPLTPIERWFFSQDFPDRHHWNQAVLLELPATLAVDTVSEALRELVGRHDSLRLQFHSTDAGWTQRVRDAASSRPRLKIEDLSDLPPAERPAAIERSANALHQSFDLAEGPLLGAALFQDDSDRQQLLLAIHHLAVDALSWSILLEDFHAISTRPKPPTTEPTSPIRPASFAAWARRLAAQATDDPELARDAGYWLSLAKRTDGWLPIDFEGGRELLAVAKEGVVVERLDEGTTRALLQDLPAVYRTKVADVLLTALLLSLESWTGRRSAIIDMEGHGRGALLEGLDITRTVGWFTTVFPVSITLPKSEGERRLASLGEALQHVKEELRRLPREGLSYGLLLHHSQDPRVRETLASLAPRDLLFNYLGQSAGVSSAFPLLDGPLGQERSLRGRRPYPLEVNARIRDGRLESSWRFSPEAHRDDTIAGLARGFHRALERLVEHCRSPEAGGHTPSDFPLASVDASDLDQIANLLGDDE